MCKRCQGKLIENIKEQALELSSNTVPYTYPYNESEFAYHDAGEYKKWKNFVFLGNLLFLYYEGTGTEFSYLDPSKTRWGIQGGNFDLNQRRSNSFQVFLNGEGISEKCNILTKICEEYKHVRAILINHNKAGNEEQSKITKELLQTIKKQRDQLETELKEHTYSVVDDIKSKYHD